MRIKSKWLYLGAIVVLLLGVVWALPAGASPGALDTGVLSTDVAHVSPDTANVTAANRTVGATLANSALDIPEFVGMGPGGETADYDEVVLKIPSVTGAIAFQTFVVDLTDGKFNNDVALLDQADIAAGLNANVLPIIDINGSGTVTISDLTLLDAAGAATSDLVITQLGSAAIGTVLVQALVPIDPDTEFVLRYATSPQESAMVSVSGDAGSFGLLAVESAAGPAGEYDGTFVVADEVIIDIGTGHGNLNPLADEQHDIPAGLQGNIQFDDESHVAPLDIDIGDVFTITVDNPPIRDINGGGVDGTDVTVDIVTLGDATVTVDATTGVLTFTAVKEITANDPVSITYRGSDRFTFTVNFPPMQAAITEADLIVPSETDLALAAADVFDVVSVDIATGAVVVGVIVGDSVASTDAVDLSSRISVLGANYLGSFELTVPIDIDSGSPETFDLTLTRAPESADVQAGINPADVVVIVDGTTGGITVEGIDGRVVTFSATRNTNSDAGDPDVFAGETFTVAFAFQVGFDPRNALEPAEVDRPIVLVTSGRRATIRSTNDVIRVISEDGPPDPSNASPTGSTPLDDDFPDISNDWTDALAGVDQTTITIEATDGVNVVTVTEADDAMTITAISGGFRASVDIDDLVDASSDIADTDRLEIPAGAETTINYFSGASDVASNAAETDADPDTPFTVGVVDPFSIMVDGIDPVLLRAFSGEWWDSVALTIQGDRNELPQDNIDAGLPVPTARSVNSSIRVLYSEALAASSILANGSQFGVAGHTVTAAQHFAEAPDNVFLTVNQLLGPNETPAVQQTGTLTDVAGNALAAPAPITAEDGIAPTPDVVPSPAFSTGVVDVVVSTDEGILRLEPDVEAFIANGPTRDETDSIDLAEAAIPGANFTITLTEIPVLDFNDDGAVDDADLDLTAVNPSIGFVSIDAATGDLVMNNGTLGDLEAGTTMTVSYRGTDPDPALTVIVPTARLDPDVADRWTFSFDVAESNVYSIVTTVEDESSTGVTGVQDPAGTGAVNFEIDNLFNAGDAPVVMQPDDPAAAPKTDTFIIRIEYTEEDNEYVGDSSGTVIVTKAELDGVSIIDSLETRDEGRINTLAVVCFPEDSGVVAYCGTDSSRPAIAEGAHTLVYSAEDALGNALEDSELAFTVVPRATFTLAIPRGLSLVSLPASPGSTDINELFGGNVDIDLVFSFEGALAKVAQRMDTSQPFDLDPSSPLSLTDIGANLTVFVNAKRGTTVVIDIPPLGANVPPLLAFEGGIWSLVPVISQDSLEDIPQGTEICAGRLLPEGGFRAAFSFERTGLVPITLTDDVSVGDGIWVLYDPGVTALIIPVPASACSD